MKALSEYRGAISEYFLLTFLRSDSSVQAVFETFAGILQALHVDIKVNILVDFAGDLPDQFQQNLQDLINKSGNSPRETAIMFMPMLNLCKIINEALSELEGSGIEMVCDEDALLPRTVFAQDPFSVLEGDGDINYILNPIYPHTNFASSYMGLVLADAPSQPTFMVRPCLYSFAGGNILAGDDYVLIGRDAINENVVSSKTSRETVLANFQQYYGVEKVISIGSRLPYLQEPFYSQGIHQPLFHIDLFITLGGPRNRADGLREEIVFVGRVILFDANTQEILAPIDGLLLEIMLGLDAIAAELDGQSVPGGILKVVRIPLVLDTVSGYYYSWNNALVENHWPSQERRIYLPDYLVGNEAQPCMAPFQHTCIETFESLGYEVRRVENNFGYYAMEMRGSLHCMVKVLRRKRTPEGYS